MTSALTLATPDHLPQIGALLARRRAEAAGDEPDPVASEALVAPLLRGGPEGAVWLIGPVRAPLGYAIVTFGWSLALGGREAWIEDVFVRETVRRRGIGREALHTVARALRHGGVTAIHARIGVQDVVGKSFCSDAGLQEAPDLRVMTEGL